MTMFDRRITGMVGITFLTALSMLVALYVSTGSRVLGGHLALNTENSTIVQGVTRFDYATPEFMRVDLIHSPAYADNGNDVSWLVAGQKDDSVIRCQDNTSINDHFTVARAYSRSTDAFMHCVDRYGGGYSFNGGDVNRTYHQTGVETGATVQWDNVQWGPKSYHID